MSDLNALPDDLPVPGARGPVFPPNEHAREVLAWLAADPAGGG